MTEESAQHSTQHKEGFLGKMFHHHHDEQKQQEGQQHQQTQSQGNAGKQHQQTQGQKKEGDFQKFKDYIKEDEKMEQQGDTYGGLM